MQAVNADDAADYYKTVGNLRTGHQVLRIMLTGKEGALNNYRLGFGGGGDTGDWTTPRHKHGFEQIRFPISGDYIIGANEMLPAGSVAYFPESAYYGPQNKTANLLMATLQFGGPSGLGYYSIRQRNQAFEDAKKKGAFDQGVFTWTDKDGKKHNVDAAQAVWEQWVGREMEYPKGRYRDLVVMNPENFTWINEPGAPGVAWKRLGTFTEREIKTGFVRVEKGKTLKFGTENAPEILFVKEGALTHDGKDFTRYAAFGHEAGEPTMALTASEPTEMFYVKMPTF